LYHIAKIWSCETNEELQNRIHKIEELKDKSKIQLLKSSIRESEADRMWALLSVPLNKIHHLRTTFDFNPLFNLYRQFQPQGIFVALDPEGTGPSTHYKVLQLVAQALQTMPEEFCPTIYGYRNVWHRFQPWEANIMVPIGKEAMQQLHDVFMSCYPTQKQASFPSPSYDGPFSKITEMIQREQFQELKILLGEENFPDALGSGKGYIFMKQMDKEEFLSFSKASRDLLLSS